LSVNIDESYVTEIGITHNCRCDVIQLVGSVHSETKDIPSVPIPDMFKTNLAESGLIFPAGHAYYKDIPKSVLVNALLNCPENAIFKTLQTFGDNKQLRLSVLHGVDETAGNVRIAEKVAKFFEYKYSIDLMPEIGGNLSWEERKKIFGKDVFDKKCPDARINGELWDFKELIKSYKSTENLRDKLSRDLKIKGKQALNISIEIKHEIKDAIIESVVKGYSLATTKKRKILIFNGNKPLFFETDMF